MSERKAREYTHIKLFETEILEMKESGKTHREIAEHFGFRDKYVVKEFIKRHNRVQKQMQAGITPRLRGRPPKGNISSEEEKGNEIKRLKMENELLRDFLHLAGRK